MLNHQHIMRFPFAAWRYRDVEDAISDALWLKVSIELGLQALATPVWVEDVPHVVVLMENDDALEEVKERLSHGEPARLPLTIVYAELADLMARVADARAAGSSGAGCAFEKL